MKSTKILPLILVTLITFSMMLSFTTQATVDNVFGDYRYSVNADDTVTIKAYTGNSSELTLPEKIDGKKVQAIGEYAFYGNINIKKVQIPEGVEVLGKCSFANCTELKDIVLPESLSKLDDAVFFGCTRLNEISLPDNITSIGDGAFYYCESLKNVEFPANLTKTGEYVFGYCRALETVKINDKLTTISPQSFIGCGELKSVKLHDNIKTIGRKAFMNCISLSDITLPESLDAVYEHAFDGCYELVINRFDGSYIEKNAFSSCIIKSLKLSDNLSYIGHGAFTGCSVKGMIIPSVNFTMAPGAFSNSYTEAFAVDADNPYFTVKDGVLFSKDMSVLIAYPSYKEGETYVIPESVKTISDYAFSQCWNLKKIVLSSTLEKIGNYAFVGANEVREFDLPETVKEIGEGAFNQCVSIKSIKIPEGVKKIRANTFEYCDALEKVYLPDSVEIIEDKAFICCPSIRSFEITKGIRKISALAFANCENLRTFEVDSENPYYTVDNNCLVSKDKTAIVVCPNALNVPEYRVSDSVTAIEANAFVNNPFIKEIYLTENVKSVGDYAFGFYKAMGKNTLDRIKDFTAYVADKGAVYDYAAKADVAVFKDQPVQNETQIELNVGEQFDFKIDNAFDEAVIYSVSDRKIATVDKYGCITGRNKGETTVIATVGTRNFVLNLEVFGEGTNENCYDYDLSDYRSLERDTYEQWEKDYYEYNSGVSFDPISAPNIGCYSGSEYVPIVAVQTGDFTRTEETYGEDVGQYYYISEGLSLDLGRHKLNENLILFSGTKDVSNITGASSTLKDMQNSIGRRFTDNAVISTSVDHGVAAGFGTGSYHTVLEIYAPADLTKGGYIKSFSQYPYEQEILLDCNQSYEVLDAGVRVKTVTDFSGNTEEVVERFVKLIVVEDEGNTEIKYQKGDVNLDGKINIKDATLVQKYLAKIAEFTVMQRKLADFNGDMTVSISDATAIQKWLAGIIR